MPTIPFNLQRLLIFGYATLAYVATSSLLQDMFGEYGSAAFYLFLTLFSIIGVSDFTQEVWAPIRLHKRIESRKQYGWVTTVLGHVIIFVSIATLLVPCAFGVKSLIYMWVRPNGISRRVMLPKALPASLHWTTYRLDRTSFSERWASLKNLRNTIKTKHWNVVKKAGDEGEFSFLDVIQQHPSLRGSLFYLNKRVPVLKKRRYIMGKRSEVDMIILTQQGIHVIEIKNWSGILRSSSNAGQWARKGRFDRDFRLVPNQCYVNNAKIKVIQDYIENSGIDTATIPFFSHIAFINPRLKLDPSIVNNDIIYMKNMDSFLSMFRVRSTKKRMMDAIHYILGHDDHFIKGYKVVDHTTQEALKSLLDGLHTWDKLYTVDGSVIAGDLLELDTGYKHAVCTSIQAGSYILVKWTYNIVIQIVFSVIGIELGHVVSENGVSNLNVDSYALFHRAGSAQPERIPMACLTRVEKG